MKRLKQDRGRQGTLQGPEDRQSTGDPYDVGERKPGRDMGPFLPPGKTKAVQEDAYAQKTPVLSSTAM